jgi:hypothetical protein
MWVVPCFSMIVNYDILLHKDCQLTVCGVACHTWTPLPTQVAESVGALLLRFEDEASLYAWQGRLSRAIYGASVKSLSLFSFLISLVFRKKLCDTTNFVRTCVHVGLMHDSPTQFMFCNQLIMMIVLLVGWGLGRPGTRPCYYDGIW